MKIPTFLAAALVLGAIVHLPAHAQFSVGGLMKNPLSSGSGSAAPVNAGDALRNARNALLSFTKAELGLSAALGGYAELASQQQLLEGMKSGDAAASKQDFENIMVAHKSASALIEKKAAENATLDASNKTLAGKSMVEYVKGLSSTRKVITSVQDLAKNPTSLGTDAGTVLYVAKEMPPVATGAATTTGTLFKYLSSNGVDMTEAKKAADDLGK